MTKASSKGGTGRKAKYEVRHDLFCPFCGESGMRPYDDKAQSGKRRYRCRACSKRTTSPLYSQPQILPKAKLTEIKKHKFFVITQAVNDTPIVEKAHKTFLKIAEENSGCYLIIPGVYRNPDLFHQGIQTTYSWPEEILPYVCNADVQLNKNIVIKGEARIKHTSINPLAGVAASGNSQSEVYGHPQVAMEMVATPKATLPKMVHSTGTISEPNYGDSILAKKAEFHHSISALIVEIQGDKFWTREVHYDGEGVSDVGKYYTPEDVAEDSPPAAIVYGDIHINSLSKKSELLLDSVRLCLDPEKNIYHDVHDHHVGSHHNKGNVIFHLQKSAEGNMTIRQELMKSVKFLSDKKNAYLIDDNHGSHLNQWFNRFKPLSDQLNLDLYYELGEMAREDTKKGGDGNLYRLFLQKYCINTLNFPSPNELFLVRGVDCSQHGHRGANGARGSAKSFARSGHKTVIAHSHTPRIEKGCYQAGVATLDLDYAVGMSSWMVTHCIIYNNGKRTLFHVVEDKLSPSMRDMCKAQDKDRRKAA